jgi:hypothetical protein
MLIVGDYVDAPTTKIPCSNVKVEKLTYPQEEKARKESDYDDDPSNDPSSFHQS